MALLSDDEIKKIREIIQETPPEEREEKAQEILSKLTPEQIQQLQGGKPQCPFCLIAQGKIPSTTIYENEDIKSVLEINPAHEGHTIIFPKQHFATVSSLDTVKNEMLFLLVSSISKSLEKIYGATNIYISNGKAAGQRFDHLVINIIPRTENDGINFNWQPKSSTEEELKKVKEKIIENLPKQEEPKPEPPKFEEVSSTLPSHEKRIP